MSESVLIILNTLLLIALLMAIGILSIKSKLIQAEHLVGISKLIVNVLLPMTIFNMVVNSDAVLSDYIQGMPYMALMGLSYAFLFGLGYVLSGWLKLQGKRKDVFRMFMIFGNIGFFGIPLITGLYPGSLSYLHLTQHNVLDAIILWTVGIMILTHHLRATSFTSTIKHMMNPTVMALILGLIFMVFGWKLPSMANGIVKGLADSLKFISLVYMGMLLSTIKVKPLLRDKSIYLLIFVKMFLFPLLLYVVASQFFIAQSAITMALMFGLPGMILVSILVALYHSDKEYAAGIVFMTTIAALITLPLLVTIFSVLGPVLK